MRRDARRVGADGRSGGLGLRGDVGRGVPVVPGGEVEVRDHGESVVRGCRGFRPPPSPAPASKASAGLEPLGP